MHGVTNRLPAAAAEDLMRIITPADITRAIRTLDPTKAAGPDGLNNQFYRDFLPELMPMLEALFNHILRGGKMPATMRRADIIPLKKKGDSPNGLDYRPISLLDTDYKLFAKVISMRLTKHLPQLISKWQSGFVPGRQLSDSITLMQAALQMAHAAPQESLEDSPILVCLDQYKAYDSMERSFLYLTLEAMGFPPEWVNVIRDMHARTQVRYLVNGQGSNWTPQTKGIRQGCPLAPFLFILGMEPLLASLEKNQSMGLTFHTTERSTTVLGVAHVDDLAMYLRHSKNLTALMATVEQYGVVSGLVVQPTKSFGICLNTTHHPTQLAAIPFLQQTETARYLGVQVGVSPSLAYTNWQLALAHMQRKLQRATEKSNAPLSRAVILNSIAAPIFTFYATYFQPPLEITKKWDNVILSFFWTGRLHTIGRLSTQLAKQDLLEEKSRGGVGLRTSERLAQDATGAKVIRWALLPPHMPLSIVGAVLLATETPRLGTQYAPTAISPIHIMQTSRSSWTTGAQVAGWWLAHHIQPSPRLLAMKSALITTLRHHMQFIWRSKTHVTWKVSAAHQQMISNVHQRITREFPPAVLSFMPSVQWTNNPWFTNDQANPIPAKTTLGTLRPCDIITYMDMATSECCFGAAHPEAEAQLWLIWSIANGTTLSPHHPCFPRVSGPVTNQVTWTWHTDCLRGHRQGKMMFETAVLETKAPTRITQYLPNKDHHVWPNNHPMIQRIVVPPVIWRRRQQPGYDLLRSIAKQWRPRPPRTPSASQTKAQRRHTRLLAETAPLLQPLTTYGERKQCHLSPYQAWWVFRWRLQGFLPRQPDQHTKTPTCQRQACKQDETRAHIFFLCYFAQHVWKRILDWWDPKLSTTSAGAMALLAQGTIPMIPTALGGSQPFRALWQVHGQVVDDAIIDMWYRIRVNTLRALWMQRNKHLYDDSPLSPQATVGLIQNECKAQQHGLAQFCLARRDLPKAQLLRTLSVYLDRPAKQHPTRQLQPQQAHLRAFFDGAALLPPRCGGGSGAILVKWTGQSWTVLAYGIRAFTNRVTNNHTEYVALQMAVDLAKSYGGTDVHIVGDSNLLVAHMHGTARVTYATPPSKYVPPSATQQHAHEPLGPQYLATRLACSGLTPLFQYVRRNYNQAADFLSKLGSIDHMTIDSRQAAALSPLHLHQLSQFIQADNLCPTLQQYTPED
jgi:ribonuclease HI